MINNNNRKLNMQQQSDMTVVASSSRNKFGISSDIQHKKSIQKVFLIVILLSVISITSCKKLVELDAPSFGIAENSVYTTDATAIAVLNGIYASMNFQDEIFQGSKSIALLTGLSSDELTLFSGVTSSQHIAYFQNNLAAINQPVIAGSEFWSPLFKCIYRCNSAMEGLNKATTLTPKVKQQLLGEAAFMRAFFYFYAVNLYGDLPLVLTSDPLENVLLARSPKTQVYDQIITDLENAQQLLSEDYLNQTLLAKSTERIRPTKSAAKAMLARVYLYKGDAWSKAESEASFVIANTGAYNLLPVLNDVFKKNSRESIWQVQPTVNSFNTIEAFAFLIPSTGPVISNAVNPVYIGKQSLANFESGDMRKLYGNWIDTTIYMINTNPIIWDTVAYPYKYKAGFSSGISTTGDMTEYFMVLRLAEQYLIRAEARAQLGNIIGAQSDINAIRNRAGLGNTTAGDKNSLLSAILHERQVELFSEWGHRWFDLKRTGKIDEVMNLVTPLKTNGTNWRSYQQLYPIPFGDIQRDPKLAQNPGYN